MKYQPTFGLSQYAECCTNIKFPHSMRYARHTDKQTKTTTEKVSLQWINTIVHSLAVIKIGSNNI